MSPDGAFRPHKTEDRRLDIQSVELPQCSRCRHTVLSVGNVQDIVLDLLVLPEATGDFKPRSSRQLRT